MIADPQGAQNVQAQALASRVPRAGPPSTWTAMRFRVRYRKTERVVIVLAPFPQYAASSTGAAADEIVTPFPFDSANAAITRATTSKRVAGPELESFFSEMERCLRAGLPPAQSLKLVTPLCKSPYFRGVISGLRYLLEQHGQKLGEAMEQFPSAFDEVAVALVRAGETSGQQAAIFARLAVRSASSRNLTSKFMSALVTPGVTMVFVFAAMTILHFFVFPTLEGNFKAIRLSGSVLPLPTQIVVGVSNFVRNYPIVWAIPVGGFLTLVFGWRAIFSAKWFQHWSVRVPVVGQAYRLIIMARALDALALLNAEAVPLERCYKLAAKVSGHYEYSEFFHEVLKQLLKGRKPFSAFLSERHRIGPEGADIAARMESAGVTGQISESLSVTATILKETADSKLDAMPKLIGPLVTVLATVIIGALVMAVFLPTFTLLLDALKGGAK